RTANLSRELARRRVAAAEPDFAIAAALARGSAEGPIGVAAGVPAGGAAGVPAGGAIDGLPHEVATAWGASTAASLLALAGSAAALHSAAALVARHDALAVRTDDAGVPTAIGSPEALRALLAGAAVTARAAARAARIATGAIPLRARLAYQLALIEAGGPLDDQLAALADLWAATAASRLAVTLARN
ncbi:MAG TPA: hypothetical protein VH165_14005, partial [Kofleriaceae bacterium]|nr:hypothetical protein [Kofleriaceae bacterium]